MFKYILSFVELKNTSLDPIFIIMRHLLVKKKINSDIWPNKKSSIFYLWGPCITINVTTGHQIALFININDWYVTTNHLGYYNMDYCVTVEIACAIYIKYIQNPRFHGGHLGFKDGGQRNTLYNVSIVFVDLNN